MSNIDIMKKYTEMMDYALQNKSFVSKNENI